MTRDCLVLAHLHSHRRSAASRFMYDDLCRTYSPEQVRITFQILKRKGWVDDADPRQACITALGDQALQLRPRISIIEEFRV